VFRLSASTSSAATASPRPPRARGLRHLHDPDVVNPDDGRRRLAELALPEAFRIRLDSQLRVVDLLKAEIDTIDARIAALFTDDRAYRAVLRVPGIGPVFAAVLRAEIGEVTPGRSRNRARVWLRWAAVEAVQRSRAGTPMRAPTNRSSPGAVPGPRTWPRSPPRVNCSAACSTRCATGTRDAWPVLRRQDRAVPGACVARAGSDRHAAVVRIDWPQTPGHRIAPCRPTAAKG